MDHAGQTALLSSYALEVTTLNQTGMVLILLALVFFAIDVVVTNHGLPTFWGLVALVLGILTFFDVIAPYSLVSLVVLMTLIVLTGIFFVGSLGEMLKARGRPVTTGAEGMIGEIGVVTAPIGGGSPGWVFVRGERWRAILAIAPEDSSGQVIKTGRRVQVVGLRDGKVVVLPFEPATSEHLPKS